MVRYFIIFALIIHSHYANTNLKNPQYRCYTTSEVRVDDPSVLGLFIMKPYENLSLEDMPGEVWKDIPVLNCKLQVSTEGRIKSFLQKTVKIKKQGMGRHYLHVRVAGVTKKVHRLVLLTFEGESPLSVDHINGDKLDNRLLNLEYVTARENVARYRSSTTRNDASLPLGVHREPNGRYKALICVNGKNVNLGVHPTAEQASIKYQEALLDIKNINKYHIKRKENPYGPGIRLRRGGYEVYAKDKYVGFYKELNVAQEARYNALKK